MTCSIDILSIPKSFEPVFLRPTNFEWYWSPAVDPYSTNSKKWHKFSDVENEIIEDAYNANEFDVEIDGDYVINLKQYVRYKKNDTEKQQSIKRVQLDRNRNNVNLRERLSFPVRLFQSMSLNSEPQTTSWSKSLLHSLTFFIPVASTVQRRLMNWFWTS
jgi:hypothetical protein